MDFVWFSFSILALVFGGECFNEATEQTSGSCYEVCPAGYFWDKRGGHCSDKKYFCKKCDKDSYTEIKNHIKRCLKCSTCSHSEVVVKPCSFTSNTKCGCKPGFFYVQENMCWDCSKVTGTTHADFKKQCTSTTVLPSTNTSTTMVSVTTKTPTFAPIPLLGPTTPDLLLDSTTSTLLQGFKTSNSTSNPAVQPVPTAKNHMVWLLSLVIFAVLLVLVWLLVFCGSMHRNQDNHSCWKRNKNAKTPAQEGTLKERCSHHSSSPSPLTFTISEETPMMSLCQDPPAHISGQIPDTGHTAARQEERSDRWPAIVLYAIIKEVPLRRWKEFLRLLSVPDQQMERVELEAGLGSIEKQYQMLRLWSQRSSASLNDVYSSLHHMDLSGCAQLLQESLEKLKWRQGMSA
ncbi:tumor necrosis factor receptor superfamily member 1A isoform X2 [Austrofundulus limnaeus]|uniref:Tumor necrosis factor receptor superfamily member 1A isoform X2 n=1 Tax=Austrofundulus limnaeus TaxID=52670 RepID=A0A2I4C042_AUSLI|nr:PREDICTED: tumor necrosis factor receptor superfamily member 1A-like isoform X2 [Austrofundulus limnaeus]